MEISVVVPVYGCPAAVEPLAQRLVAAISPITEDFEIVLVNDADPKNSWAEIEKACKTDKRIKGIELSRNFGQIRAITAGLDYCSGEWVVVMDCDLQDRPEAIPQLYKKAQEGYDVVFVKRKDRKDSRSVKFLSKAFYKVFDYFTDGNYDGSICNFSISRRKVIEAYCSMREQNRAYVMFIKWLGFRSVAIEIEGDARYEGKSSYSFWKKITLANQLITAQSNKPLQLSVTIGFASALFSFVFFIAQIIKYFVKGTILAGWTSTIVSIYFVGGLILMAIGVSGIYLGYIFNEVKGRPLYVIRTILNDEKESAK